MLYMASDHGGFKLKQRLFSWLQKEFGSRVEDLGPVKLDLDDDYPKFAAKVAKAVSSNAEDLGILLCRSGQGVCIVANKFKDIRASLAWNVKIAKASRHDDHSNVLCLPSDYVSLIEAKKIVAAWLETPWGKEKMHQRRVKEIHKLET